MMRLGGPRRADAAERELHAAIFTRRTNRSPFRRRPVPPSVLAELAEGARTEGAVLHLPERDARQRILAVAAAAELDLLASTTYRAELARWAVASGARTACQMPRSGRAR